MFDEKANISRILAGDLQVFGALVRQYQQLVFYIIDPLIKDMADKQDVSQEVFIKVYKSLDRFAFESKLSTWIAKIAYRTALNYLRDQRGGKDGVDDETVESITLAAPHPGQLSESKDLKAQLFRLMNEMPVPYKTVLTLYHWNEFSYEEIARITGVPEGTVKSYLFRARKLLKEKLTPYRSDEKAK